MSRPPRSDEDITALLASWQGGDPEAFDDLVPVVFEDLRRLARHYFTREPDGATLQPTAVVHEVYLRLVGKELVRFESRAHFFAIASRLIRQVLVDHARIRQAGKRGGGRPDLALSEVPQPAASGRFQEVPPSPERFLDLHRALDRLAEHDARKARLVELRYVCGLTVPEAAEVLEISRATAERDWTFARRWLAREMDRDS